VSSGRQSYRAKRTHTFCGGARLESTPKAGSRARARDERGSEAPSESAGEDVAVTGARRSCSRIHTRSTVVCERIGWGGCGGNWCPEVAQSSQSRAHRHTRAKLVREGLAEHAPRCRVVILVTPKTNSRRTRRYRLPRCTCHRSGSIVRSVAIHPSVFPSSVNTVRSGDVQLTATVGRSSVDSSDTSSIESPDAPSMDALDASSTGFPRSILTGSASVIGICFGGPKTEPSAVDTRRSVPETGGH